MGCFLDLPYQVTNEHIFTPDDNRGVTVKSGSNMIIYQRAILEKEVVKDIDLLVVHRYTDYKGEHYGGGGYGYGYGEGEYDGEDDYGEHYEGRDKNENDK